MNISFRPTDYSSEQDCQAIASWHNDPELNRLWIPTSLESPVASAADIRARFLKNQSSPFAATVDELAWLNGRAVGQITVLMNPRHGRCRGERVAWPSLVIGDRALHGTGLVRRFLERIAERALALGATHIEAGVFEFNRPIRTLLEKAGFQEFDRVENITTHEGRSWADIRYERKV